MSAAAPVKWSNGKRRARNGFPQRQGGPLSRTQKAALCMLCREAYEHCGGEAKLFIGLDDWRHEIVQDAVGKPGLTACVQDDYQAIAARFLGLKGESGRAMNAHIAHQTEPVRLARHALAEALRKAELPEGYAAAICRSKFKCTLDQANAKQVWQLVFDINKRR